MAADPLLVEILLAALMWGGVAHASKSSVALLGLRSSALYMGVSNSGGLAGFFSRSRRYPSRTRSGRVNVVALVITSDISGRTEPRHVAVSEAGEGSDVPPGIFSQTAATSARARLALA